MTSIAENQQNLTPETVLARLKDGNKRFLERLRTNPAALQLVNNHSNSSQPFVTILSCSDMRMPPEFIFDLDIGDVFSIRLAGNMASRNVIGNLEYTSAFLTSKLIVVLGHTNCCTIKGACDDISFGSMNEMFEHLQLSIKRESVTLPPERNSKNRRFVNNVAELNLLYNMKHIIKSSSIVRELIENQEIDMVGAMYSGETDKVSFLDMNVYDILGTIFVPARGHLNFL
jgi:carbonic anhydrase